MQALLQDEERPVTTVEASRSRPSAKGPDLRISRLLILCGDADGNLGDRAILKATCRALGAVTGASELCIVSALADWREGDQAIRALPPGPRGFLKLCAVAARSDLVICGGGGLFQDDDSLVKMPYWGLRVALMRLLCGRVVGYALGVGPLKALSSRLFARLAFACMMKISVRDQEAKDLTARLTDKPVQVVPDPAIMLPASPAREARRWLEAQGVALDGRPLIGVTTRRWFPAKPRLIPHRLASKFRAGQDGDDPASGRYIRFFADVLDEIARRHDAQFLFLPTYNLRHEGDDEVCRRIAASMTGDGGPVLTVDRPELYMAVVRELAVLVTGRMHPAIFAAAVGTPFVALAYNQKFHGFCALMEQRHRVFDVESLVRTGATDRVLEAVEDAFRDDRDELRQRSAVLQQSIEHYNAALVEALR